MRKFIILTLFLVPVFASAQKTISLKRKYLGSYVGMIPSYRVQSSEDIMFVAQSEILIKIGENQVEMTVGSITMFGTYEVMFEAKKYYLLDVAVEGQLATERIMVYKRGKHLSRDGMYPQPITELDKIKKRSRLTR